MRLSLPVLATLLAAGSLAAASTPSFADDLIPYAPIGQIATANPIVATATGTVMGYFAGSDAGDNDTIELWDKTQNTFSGFLLPNHGSTVGAPTTFLSVNAGDTLVFILDNVTTGQFEDSLNNGGAATTWSTDGYNHAYTTTYTGVPGISGLPAGLTGTFVGMEDLAITGLKPISGSDLDYNDDTFVFTDIGTASPTPEPSSFALFGTGLLAAAGTLRRKFVR